LRRLISIKRYIAGSLCFSVFTRQRNRDAHDALRQLSNASRFQG
jgi:hypothetical protein